MRTTLYQIQHREIDVKIWGKKLTKDQLHSQIAKRICKSYVYTNYFK